MSRGYIWGQGIMSRGLCLWENIFRGFGGGDYIWKIKYLVILTRHHLDGLDVEASVESSF